MKVVTGVAVTILDGTFHKKYVVPDIKEDRFKRISAIPATTALFNKFVAMDVRNATTMGVKVTMDELFIPVNSESNSPVSREYVPHSK